MGLYVPIAGCLAKRDGFDHLHDFDVVEIFCAASNDSSKRIDFTLFDYPALGSGHHPSREPFRHRTGLQDETRGM